jgi:hypothetical protein
MKSVKPVLLLVRSPLLGPDLHAAVESAGWRTEIRDPSNLSVAVLAEARIRGVMGILTVNHSPEVATLAREAEFPYVSWTIDPLGLGRWRLVEGCRCAMFVHRQALLAPLRAMGHQNVQWLPLGSPSRRWSDPVAVRGDLPPSFAGSSLQDERDIFLSRLEAWDLSIVAQVLLDFLDSFAAVAEEDRGFRGFLVAPGAMPDSLVRATEGRVGRMDLAETLDAGLAWRYRRRALIHLAQLGVSVWGDGGWKEWVGTSWKGNLRNGREMTEIYRRSALDVDVPRIHQREIVTLRAMDVMASGGALLVESGTELDTLFRPGVEYVSWDTAAERDEWIRAARGRSAQLDRIASAGREAAWSHRLEQRVPKVLEAFLALA